MAQQIIDVGNVANDGTGDPLRTAFQIVNENFNEVYSPSSISNGASRIDIVQDGNIYMTSNGISNVLVVSSTTVTVNGDLSVTGNAILSGNVVGDRIQNGATIIDIQSAGGNANLTIGGVTNVAVFAPTGEYVNGLISATGNIIGGNLSTANLISGNNISITSGMSVGGGATIAGNVVIGGTLTSSSNISLTGDVAIGNLTTTGFISSAGNITGPNVNATTVSANSLIGTLFTPAQNNITSVGTLTSLTVSGNVVGLQNLSIGTGNTGNAIIYGNLIVYGNTTTIESNTITTNDLNITVGNNQTTGSALNNAGLDVGSNDLATWRYNDATTSWQTNLGITPSANATSNLGGTLNYWNNVYASQITAAGNVSTGNISSSGKISAQGNISTASNVSVGGNIIATNIGNVAAMNFDGNVANVLLGNGIFGATPAVLGALNYTQEIGNIITINTTDTFPATVLSMPFNTNGNPVQITVTGDASPASAGSGVLQLYRNSTAIGSPLTYESDAAGETVPYALQFIDLPPTYGTYTYSLKVNSETANTTFGEAGGAVLNGIEIQNVRGDPGAPYAWRTVVANGTSIIANIGEAVLNYTTGNNFVMTGTAVSNVVNFAVSDAPSFQGNVTGANFITNGTLFGNVSSSVVDANIANIGNYSANTLRVRGTGYIINSAVTDPYLGSGTLDVSAISNPNVVIRGFDQTTSSTSGPELRFVRKQQSGYALQTGLDAGRVKFYAVEPNNDFFNPIAEIAAVTAAPGTSGELDFYVGNIGNPQLVLTLSSTKRASFAGDVSAVGNVTGGNIITAGAMSAASYSTNGNITGGNVLVGSGIVSTSGTITGGNLLFGSGVVSGTGNITAGYFAGDGSQLTNITANAIVGNYGNSNVTNLMANFGSNTISTSGNITGGNVLVGSGVVSTSGNITGGNVLFGSGVVSGTGNVTAGYFAGDGSQLTNLNAGAIVGAYGNANVTNLIANFGSNTISTSGNITGGNLLFGSGVVSGTGAITGGNITGGNVLFGSGVVSGTGNITAGYFAGDGSQLTNLNAGSIVGAYGNANVTNLMANFGSNTISTSGNITGGNVIATDLTGTLLTASQTNITAVGTLTSLNSGTISSSGNVTGANINTTGQVSATGNITGGNLTVGSGTITVNNIVNGGANNTGNIGSASNYFNYIFATATTALYADLAENYLADTDYEPGTVLSFGGAEEVTASTQDSDRRIIGVVSTRPSYIMNAGLTGNHVVCVALQGRVPCRVQGPVRRGDMMVSAGNGCARAEEDPRVGTVIGKSLEDFNGDVGVIEVVIGRI